MNLHHILIRAAVDDQPEAIGFQAQFGHKMLRRENNLLKDGGVQLGKRQQAADFLFWHNQDVGGVAWFGVAEGHHPFSFVQSVNRN